MTKYLAAIYGVFVPVCISFVRYFSLFLVQQKSCRIFALQTENGMVKTENCIGACNSLSHTPESSYPLPLNVIFPQTDVVSEEKVISLSIINSKKPI